MDEGPLDVRPLQLADWDDLVALFGTRGDPAWCWCQYFATNDGSYVAGPRHQLAQRNKPALLRQIRSSDRPLGVLAREGPTPVGWLALGPRSSYPRLAGWPRSGDTVDDDVWAATCFVVRVGRRRRGVSGALLAAGIELARAHGATAIEGHPVDVEARERSPSSADLYHGVASVFLRHGFREVGRLTPSRPVMRLDLEG